MKPWQHGLELDYLKSIEELYNKEYNIYSASVFSAYKKNDIARDLHEKKLIKFDDAYYVKSVAKVKSPITCYHDVTIGYKEPGDITLSKLIGSDISQFYKIFDSLHDKNIWVYVWQDDTKWNTILENNGFKFINGKVTTFAEVYNIWYRPGYNILLDSIVEKQHPKLSDLEQIALKKIGDVDISLIDEIDDRLKSLYLDFAKSDLTAYVNKDWSALSLRGYSDDYKFIADPNEMSKKWHEKHPGPFTLQDTKLFNEFPMVRKLFTNIFSYVEWHRICFMKMKPMGTLTRHTDQIDWNHGLTLGKLVRFHFPIYTNPKVICQAWELNGNLVEMHMEKGKFYLLDTRKPHKVINDSNEERIHLTIDVRINEKVKNIMLGNV